MENFVINLARKPRKFESFLKPNDGNKIDFRRYEACDGAALKRTFPAFNFDCILNGVYPKIDIYAAYPPLVLPKDDSNL